MSTWGGNALALLVWPGLLSSVVLGWFYLWVVRKLTARLQGRQGPPFYQPFFDFIKLLGKQTIVPGGINPTLFYLLPAVSLGSTVFALALLPAPGNPMQSFPGDLIVFLYLLEMPVLCEVLAGFATRSPYGQVGATREAMMSLAYNLPFLAAVIALAARAGSFSLTALAHGPLSWVHLAAALAFILALPARIKMNPFSIPNAEQEIVAGAYTEFNGLPLALFELSHATELVAMVGLFAALFILPLVSGPLAWVAYLLLSLLLVAAVTGLATATARLKLNQAFKLYWSWGAAAALVALLIAFAG
ncbi:MAG: NADH-quinone oxidoreductase subunit H [Chloroflexi bacterium]|nr:NADH-quinone oxidoreductase subunit H [Chloroflexota bacterium]